MNDMKRRALTNAKSALNNASAVIASVIDSENDSIDNIPENLQSSDRFARMERAVSLLEDAIDYLDSAMTNIDEASE